MNKRNKTFLTPLSYHVKEIADLDSFAQVPDVDVAVMAGGQHDAGVEGVRLQHKHLVVMTLKQALF